MSDKKTVDTGDQEVVDKAIGFWENNSKKIITVSVAIIVVVGGYLGYKNLIQLPKEQKANEELFAAENNFRKDSFNLALNGSGSTPGLLKVISKYSGTKAANLAHYYAGASYLQMGEYQKAVDQLSDFSANGAKQVEAKAEGLLGDAYAELKKNDDAIAHYKNAGTIFGEDQAISSEYLFRGAMLSEMTGKTDQAIELYQILKDKYPRTDKGFIVDKYLARLGIVK
ncbi:MAG: tetratricopeptide repeat protein [Chitinophagaceae bacterium]|jgi:TolA-binding protein|nr:tetratricopeptide repeat protein [Chitinophagaceae bacterium]